MKSEIDSFQYFSVMERGASHKEKNMPLQDFASSLKGSLDKDDKTINYVIASISDGHGSSQHFRSDRGAEFACEAVKEAFCEFMEKAKDFSSDKNKNRLKKLIYSKWYEMVIEDISDKPFEKIEIEKIDKDKQRMFQYAIDTLKEYEYSYDDFKQGYNKYYEKIEGALNYLLTAYGCTLISVLSCDKFTLAVQIGDGSCVAFYKDGSCNIPIPEEEKNMANITTSLCKQKPDECRIHIFKERPVAVFVTSDGIDDSYGTGESLFNFYRRLCFNFSEKGIDFKNDLQNSLSEISSRGSKDDISISGIYDECELSKLKDVIKKRYEKGVYQARLNEIKDRDNGYNIDALKSKLKDMENKEKERNKEIRESNTILELLRKEIDKFKEWFSTKFKSNDKYKKWKDEKISELSEITNEIQRLNSDIDDLFKKLNEKRKEKEDKEEKFNALNEELDKCKNKISKYKQNDEKLKEQENNIADLEKENKEQKQKYNTYKEMYDKFVKDKERNLENKTNYESKIRELDKEINKLLENIGNTENFEIPEELSECNENPCIQQENTNLKTEPINQENENHIHIVVEKVKLNKETYPLIHNEHQEEDTDDEQAIQEQRENMDIDVHIPLE